MRPTFRPSYFPPRPYPGSRGLSQGRALVAWWGERGNLARADDVTRGTVPDQRTDAELLLDSQVEPAAFVELYRRHAEDLLRYFARRTLDPEAAAELVAETFAEAFASRENYNDTGANGVAWLYGIGRHQLGRYFRMGRVDLAARRKVGIPPRELPPEDYERIEELVDFAPLRAALTDALESIPSDQREALRLHILEDLPYPDVAERLHCAESAARQRVSRGLRRLALVLQEQGLSVATEVE